MADAAEDQDSITLDLGPEKGELDTGPLEYSDDEPNLVTVFMGNKEGEEKLKDLSIAITSVFDENWSGTEEFRQRMSDNWRLFACELPPKTWPWKGCLSRDTEILTDAGWKRIDVVNETDRVLTRRDEDGRLEWNRVEATVQQEATHLLHFKSKSIDLLVTPNHMMVTKRPCGETVRKRADEVWETTKWKIPLVCEAEDGSEGELFGKPAGDVAEFFGWFLSEGWIQKSVLISQSRTANPGKCLRIEGLLGRLGFGWSYSGSAYIVHIGDMPGHLVDLLREQGKCDEKHVPRFFMAQPAIVIRRLLEALVDGDGHVLRRSGKKDVTYLYTTSRQLADDTQELSQLAGAKATISIREPGGVSSIKGRPIVAQRRGYVVCIGSKTWAKLDGAKRGIVPYNDTSYCVTVKNHSIYVRRNGKAAWVGNSANPNIPITIENISRLSLRTFGEIFADLNNIFRVLPVGPEDRLITDVLTIHGNWQISEQIRDFPRQMHRGILGFYMIGDVTAHSFYDTERRVNRHEVLLPDQFLIPYVYTTTQPDYSDVPFVCKILLLQRHELQARRGEWEYVDEVLKKVAPSYFSEPEQAMRETVAQVQGTEPADDAMPKELKHAPYKLLWFEGWLELPNQDRDRYVQAIVDYQTKHVMHLSIHEEPDWQDQRRFDGQMAQREQYLQQLEHWENTKLNLANMQEQVAMGQEQGQFGVLQGDGMIMQLDQIVPPEPMMPGWMMESMDPAMMPEPVRMVPINLFAHGVCVEPLVGPLGIGYGRIQADLQRAANVAHSQFTDAATLENANCIITSENVQLPQDTSFAPGKIIRVPGVPMGELQNSIMPIKPGGPSAALPEVVRMATQMAQSSIQAPNVLSGEPGKSGETFRGQQARQDAATKQLTVMGGKVVDWCSQILRNNAKLNSKFLKEEEFFEVTDHVTMKGQILMVSRRMYERDYRTKITADMRFSSQAQRIQEADDMMGIVMKIPPLQQNLAFIWAALKAMLEARGKVEFIPLLGPPPPPPQTPLGIPMMMGPDGQPHPVPQGPPPQGHGNQPGKTGQAAPPSPGGPPPQANQPSSPGPANA